MTPNLPVVNEKRYTVYVETFNDFRFGKVRAETDSLEYARRRMFELATDFQTAGHTGTVQLSDTKEKCVVHVVMFTPMQMIDSAPQPMMKRNRQETSQ